MKYRIERNTVQETLVIPLYARKMCSQLFPSLYQDRTAAASFAFWPGWATPPWICRSSGWAFPPETEGGLDYEVSGHARGYVGAVRPLLPGAAHPYAGL